MNKFNALALANTLAITDLVLHPLFHLWVYVSPRSYEWIMGVFVAGLHLNVTSLDTNLSQILIGTISEAGVFWLLGFGVASLYNRLAKT